MPSVTSHTPTSATPWPAQFRHERAGVGTFAVREVPAPADAVFAWARRIDLHPEFYKGLHLVRHLGGSWPAVDAGTKLGFLVDGTPVPLVSVIAVDRAQRSFAWGGGGPGLSICHAFTVTEVDEHTSLIRSEERWVGAIATVLAPVVAGPMQKVQTNWAAAIARAARQHPAGPPA